MSEALMREAAAHVAGAGAGDEQVVLGELLLSPGRVLAAEAIAPEAPTAP